MVETIRAPCLAELSGIRHGFFTRAGGVSQGIYAGLNCGPGSNDDPGHVAANRTRVAEHLGAAHADVVTLYQVHGATALHIDGPVPTDDRPKADAVVTRTPGLAVGVLTADCAPVLFADADARVVAAAHAGWRGAVAGILEATIAEMERQGALRRNIRAAIGPAINQESYEVSPEFETELVTACRGNARFFARAQAGGRPHFDLPGYVESRLLAANVGRVERHSPCTYANESFFYSFRRSQHRSEADYGRQISAIVVA
jgi:purine-nucleoside/S-methyl-5'-thioadenosine phosphorylase / adenosine deaminase